MYKNYCVFAGIALVFSLFFGKQCATIGEWHKSNKVSEVKMQDLMPDELKQLIIKTLNSPEDSWWKRNLTNSYKWLRTEEIYWIIDSETDKSLMAIKNSDGSYKCLNCPGGIPVISSIIEVNLGKDPIDKLGVENFARLLMEWHSDPRGYVATLQFFEKKQSTLDSWLMGKETNPQALRDICIEPIFKQEEDGRWSLAFNLINRYGGVEQWTVKGKSRNFEIQSIDIKSLKENGTFYYPDEL
jgi:hypothetical protein